MPIYGNQSMLARERRRRRRRRIVRGKGVEIGNRSQIKRELVEVECEARVWRQEERRISRVWPEKEGRIEEKVETAQAGEKWLQQQQESFNIEWTRQESLFCGQKRFTIFTLAVLFDKADTVQSSVVEKSNKVRLLSTWSAASLNQIKTVKVLFEREKNV